MSRKLDNVDYESPHPWPDEIKVQGGDPLGNRGAFVEAFPGQVWLRGDAPTLQEADDKCWAQYQDYLTCDHGPFVPRHYENGCGYCVKCRRLFTNVCEPSERVKVEKLACERVVARYGEHIPALPQWVGLVADEEARIWAISRGVVPGDDDWPQATTEPPSPEEYVKATRFYTDDAYAAEQIGQVLESLAAQERGDAGRQ